MLGSSISKMFPACTDSYKYGIISLVLYLIYRSLHSLVVSQNIFSYFLFNLMNIFFFHLGLATHFNYDA